METQNIAIKFPEKDVENMDKLVNSGKFISRSDLIRTGTRNIIETQKIESKEMDDYILYMEKEGTFKDPELKILVELYIGNGLSEIQKVIAKRLVRHPFGIVKIKEGSFVLTDNGRDVAEGFIDSLLHLRRIKNVK
jgi:Arc/MetJ-type ribon-helix-helix transcriptional regulator|tara:strand:- start:179 stop:586 length:408 start_codon:yes stop_codon:yes gene_type:complete